VKGYLEYASAVCLAEVKKIRMEDNRPADGPWLDVVELRIVESSGAAPERFGIALGDSGMHPPPPYVPHGPLYPNPLKEKLRYWFVFDGSKDWKKYPQGVVAWWPEDGAPTEILKEAIAGDLFKWHPTFDAGTSRFYGYRVDAAKREWSARVWTKEKVLWERTAKGTFDPQGYAAWSLHERKDWGPYERSEGSGKMLATCAKVLFERDNAFGLPAGDYLVNEGLDFDTGKVVVAIVNNPIPGVSCIERQMSLETGKTTQAMRDELVQGAAGAESWIRSTVRTFDEEGRITSEKVYRVSGQQRMLISTK